MKGISLKKIIVALMFLLVSSTFATIHLVPSQYSTIQAGIDAALEGDTVLVAPGTYTGTGNRDLTFNGVNIVLLSEKGADSTIVDVQADSLDQHTAIYLNNGEDTSSVIDGFTFTNAYYDLWGFKGGALFFDNGKANVQNCNILNSGLNGIFLDDPDSLSCRISNCRIEGNGLGIYNYKYGTIVENCIVQNNQYNGIEFFREMVIRNTLVAYNGFAGVAYSPTIGQPPVLLDHCTIVFNDIGFVFENVPPKNSSVHTGVDTATVRNCIIAFNNYGGIANYFADDNHYNCINTNLYSNANFNWQNDKYWHGDTFGNVSSDPLFCDTATGDFTLQSNSYCADGNNPSGSTIGLYDVGCAGGCCIGNRGNLDGDPDDQVDIADLVWLVTYTFASGPAPDCIEEADVDGNTLLDIGDIVYLVNYMFNGGPQPAPCLN
ncbi:MAG: DUF5123 domain-containing protein [Calditrichaeota bacterium]|nr:MAG: DUF5123 domain-containing protein [Calditrichota bacterium]